MKEPAFVLLAIKMASSSVLNRNRGATGPNTSSLKQGRGEHINILNEYKPIGNVKELQ